METRATAMEYPSHHGHVGVQSGIQKKWVNNASTNDYGFYHELQ